MGIAAGGRNPAAHPVGPVLPAYVRPVGQDLQQAAFGQVDGALGHHALDQRVGGRVSLPIGQAGRARRGHHIGRVGHDEVEPLAGHRPVEIAEPQVHPRSVEPEGQPGQLVRPRVQVGGDDMPAVPGQVQALYTAARAEVQRPFHRAPDGQLGEGSRGGRDPDHVVWRHRDDVCVEVGSEIGSDPELPLVAGVRADVEKGADLLALNGQDSRGGERRRESRAGSAPGRPEAPSAAATTAG